ncbi:MAG TPA: lasso peptide biosynthesis B2 protein [Gemmatimonadaceae bacterium]|nr:lasso peptide biosynthesis B2 protein [Gemmatimonadaceae bacterium]
MTRRSLRKLAKLTPREWVDLLQAQVELIAAQILVSTRPTGRLVSSDAPRRTEAEGPFVPDPRAARLALAVSRAADYGIFHPLCLVRAVAINRMLERRGIRGSRIRIGVRVRGNRFLAHAWVEYGDRVIGDSEEHVDSFAELTDVRLLDAK